jgi:hypothetical protein
MELVTQNSQASRGIKDIIHSSDCQCTCTLSRDVLSVDTRVLSAGQVCSIVQMVGVMDNSYQLQ